jgi:hypothetical protein
MSCCFRLAPLYRSGTELQKTCVRERGADNTENTASSIFAKICLRCCCLATEILSLRAGVLSEFVYQADA